MLNTKQEVNRIMTKQIIASGRTKQKIINAARTLFKSKGYSETSITDIINEGGVSRGNLYYHFNSKESLFIYIMEEDARVWIDGWYAYSKQIDDPKDRLYALAEYFEESALNHPIYGAQREFLSTLLTPDTIERFTNLNTNYREVFIKIFKDAQNKGYWNKYDVNFLSLILYSMLTGIEDETGNIATKKLKGSFTKSIDIFLNGI
jgi:AcrR family transcriptional regulator